MFISLFQISTIAQGKVWDENKSPAQKYTSSLIGISASSSNNSYLNNDSYQSATQNTKSYDQGYQENSSEIKSQTEAFFLRKQMENAVKRE